MSNNTKESIYIDTRYDSLVKVYESYLLVQETVFNVQCKTFFEQIKKQVVDYAKAIGFKDVDAEIIHDFKDGEKILLERARLIIKQGESKWGTPLTCSSKTHLDIKGLSIIDPTSEKLGITISKEGIEYYE